jgi:hypothetical protein
MKGDPSTLYGFCKGATKLFGTGTENSRSVSSVSSSESCDFSLIYGSIYVYDVGHWQLLHNVDRRALGLVCAHVNLNESHDLQ